MKCHRRKPRVHPPRWSTSALAVALLLTLLPTVLHAQAAWNYDQDVHVTYEFDDNVDEALSDPVRAQIARLAYSGGLEWGEAGAQRLSLSYQGGFKRHFGLVGNDFDLANQFVNEGGVGYVRRVGANLALGGAFAIKNRKWTDDFFFINEDGFTSVGGEASATLNLRPLAPDRPARLEIGTRFGRVDFENLDQPFDERSVGGFTSLTEDFGEDVSVTWQYSVDRIRYPGRGVVRRDDDDPAPASRLSARIGRSGGVARAVLGARGVLLPIQRLEFVWAFLPEPQHRFAGDPTVAMGHVGAGVRARRVEIVLGAGSEFERRGNARHQRRLEQRIAVTVGQGCQLAVLDRGPLRTVSERVDYGG